MKKVITPEGSIPVGAFSPGVTFGDWIFLSGQGGFNPETGELISDDIGEQTEQTFRNIKALLGEAGASLDDVVSCLVHIADLAEFPSFNAAYEKQFPNVKPVRTTVRADLLSGMRVEITVIARTG
jgi:2-iminobutanoate/2-iminopropanoate deaminase